MTTGLDNKRTPTGEQVTSSHMEWPLYFCNVKTDVGKNVWEVGEVPPKVAGGEAGGGVTIVHTDTGWTGHPELTETTMRRADARNFLEGGSDARDPLFRFPVIDFPSHGTTTASVMMSAAGHPNEPFTPPVRYPDYDIPPALFVSGVAPNIKYIPCRVTSSVMLYGDSLAALTRGLYHAVKLAETDASIGVISISLGLVEEVESESPGGNAGSWTTQFSTPEGAESSFAQRPARCPSKLDLCWTSGIQVATLASSASPPVDQTTR